MPCKIYSIWVDFTGHILLGTLKIFLRVQIKGKIDKICCTIIRQVRLRETLCFQYTIPWHPSPNFLIFRRAWFCIKAVDQEGVGWCRGPRTPKRSFFSSKSQTFRIRQIDKLWSIWCIFGGFISTHCDTIVFPLSINQPLFLQKTKPLYPNSKYLFGVGIWIWIWTANN